MQRFLENSYFELSFLATNLIDNVTVNPIITQNEVTTKFPSLSDMYRIRLPIIPRMTPTTKAPLFFLMKSLIYRLSKN